VLDAQPLVVEGSAPHKGMCTAMRAHMREIELGDTQPEKRCMDWMKVRRAVREPLESR
jgi:hypothetical protein